MLIFLLDHPKISVGGFLLLFSAVVAVFAPYISPLDPYAASIPERLKPPSWMKGGAEGHLLGVDQVGRDVSSRIIWGSRISLTVAVLTVVLAMSIGVILGVTAGYFGGAWDSIVSNLLNVILAFPFVLLALALIPILGSGFHNIILVLGLTGWPIFARIARSKTQQVKAMTYIEAAQAVGVPKHLILLKHILPNLSDSIITLASLEASRMVIMESFLSFIGLGVPPPTPSWGLMLGEAREYIFTQWWLMTFPGLALFFVTLGFALLGDGLRDLFDPTIE